MASYQFSHLFKFRVDSAIVEFTNYSEEQNSSVGLRINFAKNSWQIIKKNPIIGIGTGDFPNEYKKINQNAIFLAQLVV